MIAEEILAKMMAKYSECSTYSDTGIFRSTCPSDGLNDSTFRTIFVRPGKIYFSIEQLGKEHVVWSDSKTVRAYGKKHSQPATIEKGLEWIMQDHFYREVPFLLMPEIGNGGVLKNKYFTALKSCKHLQGGYHLRSAEWSSAENTAKIPTYMHLCIDGEFALKRVCVKLLNPPQLHDVPPTILECIYLSTNFDRTVSPEIFEYSS